MSLSKVEGRLPAGFRFHPRDDELICDYLINKLLLLSPLSISMNSGDTVPAFALLVDVDLNKCEPWDLPEIACVGGKEWYFYSQRDRKYATGLRTNRATVSGYWKATGKDRTITRKGKLVGMRKTLVFYQGRAPKGRKTDWVMHEFRLEGPFNFSPTSKSSPNSQQEDLVLCRVFHKSRESLPPKSSNAFDESGCSALPALMDSYISFDNTPPTSAATNDDEDEENYQNRNHNNSLVGYHQQVPCFSINNMSPNHPTNLTHLFHVAPTQNIATSTSVKAGDGGGPMGAYYAPTYENCMQQSVGGDGVSTVGSDRHVVKTVLSHLPSNMESSADELADGGENSESYISDVMWNSHY